MENPAGISLLRYRSDTTYATPSMVNWPSVDAAGAEGVVGSEGVAGVAGDAGVSVAAVVTWIFVLLPVY